MNEEEIRKKIVDSAQAVEIPKVLEPEQMKWRLRQEKRRRKKKMIQRSVVAACLCLCFGLAGTTMHNTVTEKQHPARQGEAVSQEVKEESAQDTQAAAQPVKKLGKVYKQAKSYEQVYKVLKKGGIVRNDIYYNIDYNMADGVVEKSAASEDVAADGASGNTAGSSYEEVDDGSYSTTNLQVEGVDESDIIKTDGKYLYVVQDQEVKILALNKGNPKLATTIKPEGFSDADWISELYVADGKLVLVAESTETELEDTTYVEKNGDGIKNTETGESVDLMLNVAEYRITRQVKTKVLSYDISNPKKPVYLDQTEQDGGYRTSRKVDDKLYLFTTNYLSVDESLEKNGNTEDLWLPTVDGEKIAVDCIYLPKQGNASLTMSCIQLGEQHTVLDTKLLINDGADYYITKNSIYIYNTVYNFSDTDVTEKTQIARFAITEEGKIQAVAAKTVRGSIEDTFAINEQGGYLRVLTSITSAETWENRVYVLDSNLELQGKLTKLAKGERIYAARFFGDTGYFVTYRNTDPLFTVDLSNPKEPKIIGELKITGFSDYLHFWSKDKLLGIGYETDEKTGEFLGVKLTMFDISDPSKVTAEATTVIKNADSSPATDDYKTVLIDKKKNLIAFTTESYDEYTQSYRVYSYKDGKFTKQLTYGLEDRWSYDYRSLYAGNVLYLVNTEKAIAFDMKNQFEKLGGIEF